MPAQWIHAITFFVAPGSVGAPGSTKSSTNAHLIISYSPSNPGRCHPLSAATFPLGGLYPLPPTPATRIGISNMKPKYGKWGNRYNHLEKQFIATETRSARRRQNTIFSMSFSVTSVSPWRNFLFLLLRPSQVELNDSPPGAGTSPFLTIRDSTETSHRDCPGLADVPLGRA